MNIIKYLVLFRLVLVLLSSYVRIPPEWILKGKNHLEKLFIGETGNLLEIWKFHQHKIFMSIFFFSRKKFYKFVINAWKIHYEWPKKITIILHYTFILSHTYPNMITFDFACCSQIVVVAAPCKFLNTNEILIGTTEILLVHQKAPSWLYILGAQTTINCEVIAQRFYNVFLYFYVYSIKRGNQYILSLFMFTLFIISIFLSHKFFSSH